ncbi:MAG: ThuA domain-containing protein [Planctomycetota bacterium]|nr:MAG: ThuA domain-containing protein [Planctomycetota bacterium]
MPNALIFSGGWDGHEPQQCAQRFAAILGDAGFQVTIDESLARCADVDFLQSQDLIIPLWTMGEITREQSQGLTQAIRSGVGLGGWHGGMCDAFRGDVNYQFMTGGQWVQHPGGVIDYRIHVCDHLHPISQSIDDFDIHSEQYYMHCDPGNHVLATTTFAGDQEGMDWIRGTCMPVSWIRPYGKGRVFYASIGHVDADFAVPQALQLVTRGLLWAARQEHRMP